MCGNRSLFCFFCTHKLPSFVPPIVSTSSDASNVRCRCRTSKYLRIFTLHNEKTKKKDAIHDSTARSIVLIAPFVAVVHKTKETL